MAMALHVPADDGAVEDVEGGEEGGGAVALVVVRHRAEPPLLHRQAGLGPVQCLDLALFVDRQHDGVGRRIEVVADDVAQLVDELRIIGELELAPSVGRETMRLPAAPDRTGADARLLRHYVGGPVGRLARRIGKRQCHDELADIGTERRNARRPRLVAQQPVTAFRGEALLPAPHAGLRLAGAAHDLDVPTPSADKSTISARHTCFCGALRSLVSAVRRARSAGETVNDIPVRMRKTRTRRSERESRTGLLMSGGNHYAAVIEGSR